MPKFTTTKVAALWFLGAVTVGATINYPFYCAYPKATIGDFGNGPQLMWKGDGKKVVLEVTSMPVTKFGMEWQGKKYTAEMKDGKLHWSDGDVWVCPVVGTAVTTARPVVAAVDPCAPPTTPTTTIKPRICPTIPPCPNCWLEICISFAVCFLLGGCLFTALDKRCCPNERPEYEIETQIYEKAANGKRTQLAAPRRADAFTPSGDSNLASYHASFR